MDVCGEQDQEERVPSSGLSVWQWMEEGKLVTFVASVTKFQTRAS